MSVVDLIRKVNGDTVTDQDMASYYICNIVIDIDSTYNRFINRWVDGDDYLDPLVPRCYNIRPGLDNIYTMLKQRVSYDTNSDKRCSRLYIEFYRYTGGVGDYITAHINDLFIFITEEFISEHDFSLKGLLCILYESIIEQIKDNADKITEDISTSYDKAPRCFSTDATIKNISPYSIGSLRSVYGSITINRYNSINDILPMGTKVYYNGDNTSEKYKEYTVAHSKIINTTDTGLELTLLPEDPSDESIVVKTSPWDHNRTNILTYDPDIKYINIMKTIENGMESIKYLSQKISDIEKNLTNAKTELELLKKEKN